MGLSQEDLNQAFQRQQEQERHQLEIERRRLEAEQANLRALEEEARRRNDAAEAQRLHNQINGLQSEMNSWPR